MTKRPCGIVMPISAMGDCSPQHWADVRTILEEAIEDAGYLPRIVSLGDEISIIHERIVNNLYQDEIVVCDVSCKNANVMFELGMRLAFDKPVIIVKDDETDYSFDTSPVEHIGYPRSLRFGQIKDFKSNLTKKIQATVKAKRDNPDFSPFLRSFGPLKSVKLETKEIGSQEAILEYLTNISNKITSLEAKGIRKEMVVLSKENPYLLYNSGGAEFVIPTNRTLNAAQTRDLTQMLSKVSGVVDTRFKRTPSGINAIVTVTNRGLDRHGNMEEMLNAMVDGFFNTTEKESK